MQHISIQAILQGCHPKAPFNRQSLLLFPDTMHELVQSFAARQRLRLPHQLAMGITDEKDRPAGVRLTLQSNHADLRLETWAADNAAEMTLVLRNAPVAEVEKGRATLHGVLEALNPSHLRIGEEHRKDAVSPASFVWAVVAGNTRTWRGGGTMRPGQTIVETVTRGRIQLSDAKAVNGNALSLRTR